MILRIDGDISRYYVETLCLVFFPGSTFGENEVPAEGIPEVYVSVKRDAESTMAYASIRLNDRMTEATATIDDAEQIFVATQMVFQLILLILQLLQCQFFHSGG